MSCNHNHDLQVTNYGDCRHEQELRRPPPPPRMYIGIVTCCCSRQVLPLPSAVVCLLMEKESNRPFVIVTVNERKCRILEQLLWLRFCTTLAHKNAHMEQVKLYASNDSNLILDVSLSLFITLEEARIYNVILFALIC